MTSVAFIPASRQGQDLLRIITIIDGQNVDEVGYISRRYVGALWSAFKGTGASAQPIVLNVPFNEARRAALATFEVRR